MSAIPGIAVREMKCFDQWHPIENGVADLRLAKFLDEEIENGIVGTLRDISELHTQASYISTPGYEALHGNCPNLRILNLNCAHKTGDVALSVIARFTELEELNLSMAHNGVEGGDPGVEDITDHGVMSVLNGCTKLTKIDLSGTHVKKFSLEYIVGLKNLKILGLRHGWDLEKEDIAALRRERPDLEIIESGENIASQAFRSLLNGVRKRYYQLILGDKGPSTKFDHRVFEKEKPYMSPNVFFC